MVKHRASPHNLIFCQAIRIGICLQSIPDTACPAFLSAGRAQIAYPILVQHHTIMKTHSGFSLIELMVAVAILAILASVAVPAFQGMLAQSNLTTQTNDLIGALQYTRSEAIKRNQTVALCSTNSASGTGCNGGGSSEHWIVVNNNGTVLRRGQIKAVQLSATGVTGGRIAFASNGLTTGSPVLTLCSDAVNTDNIVTININAAGRTNTTRLSGSC